VIEADSRRVISDAYRLQQQELHKNPNYGVASLGFAPIVASLVRDLGVTTLCDYGAGKQNLKKGLKTAGVELGYAPYDPAFPEYGDPQPADLVCCIDVLEHIEPDYLDNVLDELARLTVKFGFFTIHTGPAMKVLSDGRNAHLIQEPASWWLPRLRARFNVVSDGEAPGGFFVLVTPLGG
jgi:hypothetical protein